MLAEIWQDEVCINMPGFTLPPVYILCTASLTWITGNPACRNITTCHSSMLLLGQTAAQVFLVGRRVPIDAASTAERLQPRSSAPMLHLFHQPPVHAHSLLDNIPCPMQNLGPCVSSQGRLHHGERNVWCDWAHLVVGAWDWANLINCLHGFPFPFYKLALLAQERSVSRRALRHHCEHDIKSTISDLVPTQTLMPMKVMRDESAP
jgi:hypothetical protein